MDNYKLQSNGQMQNSNKSEKNINSAVSKIMDIEAFEDGVRKGLYSDSLGTAYLILNGTLYSSYNVYIDSRRITKAGSVVSFESILKTYSKDQIAIRFDYKDSKFLSRRAYVDSLKKKM